MNRMLEIFVNKQANLNFGKETVPNIKKLLMAIIDTESNCRYVLYKDGRSFILTECDKTKSNDNEYLLDNKSKKYKKIKEIYKLAIADKLDIGGRIIRVLTEPDIIHCSFINKNKEVIMKNVDIKMNIVENGGKQRYMVCDVNGIQKTLRSDIENKMDQGFVADFSEAVELDAEEAKKYEDLYKKLCAISLL